ncbi:MAG: zonular occludens toxin family protein [Roseateles asaccharophilus]|uniref:zonular occludens toxin family protein n=1 Tax=Roseateles asaccharophilus TaxID=582607 RepID=UPI00391BA2C0
MIIFHEGLPGSGKSYEAVARRIVPALASGRPVDAYVEGLNHAKLAQLAKISEEQCRALLVALGREQVPQIHEHARKNALIVLDEAQNFWGNRASLSKEVTQFVTEHRHLGQDIVLMGQDVRDVHAIWRRRVELKLSFLKLSAFGTTGRYSVTTYRHLGGDEYQRVGLVAHKYDKAYFGTYKSHVDDQVNAGEYKDSRALVWNHWGFKYGAPVLVVGAIWAFSNLYSFFKAENQQAIETKPARSGSGPVAVQQGPVSVVQGAEPSKSQPAPAAASDQRSPVERMLSELSANNRIRLGGLISSSSHTSGIVEWLQGGNVVSERMTLDQLRTLGVAVLVSGESVQLAVGEWRALATTWPLEDSARVSAQSQNQIRGSQPVTAQQDLPPGLASLGGQRAIELPGQLRSVR